jgi:hypothetical protein
MSRGQVRESPWRATRGVSSRWPPSNLYLQSRAQSPGIRDNSLVEAEWPRRRPRVERWLCLSLHMALFLQISYTPSHNPLVLCVPLVCRPLLRTQPGKPRDMGPERQSITRAAAVVGSHLIHTLYKKHFSLPRSKANQPALLGGTWLTPVPLYLPLHIPMLRGRFRSWMNSDMQVWCPRVLHLNEDIYVQKQDVSTLIQWLWESWFVVLGKKKRCKLLSRFS